MDAAGPQNEGVTPRELNRLRDAIAFKQSQIAKSSPAPFIPHRPTPQQEAFLRLDCLEAFYGGAAGGGKSDALLMGALQYVHVPGYAALILRRTYQDLARSDAIMARADEWLHGTAAKWRAETRTWTFPSGATLSFGYFDTLADRRNYQGGAWQYVAFDELTQFPEAWYLYLFSRLRKTHQNVPLRMRSASNPGDIGHAWVHKRFVSPGATDRPFIPAKLTDNPHVDASSYLEALSKLDSTTRKQLLEGVWIQDGSGLVYRYSPPANDIEAIPRGLTTFLVGIDYGYTDETAFTVLGWRANDPTVYVVESFKRGKMTPSKAAAVAHELSNRYQPVQMVADIGGLGKGYAEEARARFTLPIEAADKANKRGYIDLLNGDLERGRVKVLPGPCDDLISEWSELPWHEDRQKEQPGAPNHCADATLYAWRAACAYHEREPAPPPTQAEVQKAAEDRAVASDEADVEREAAAEWWEVA